MSIGNVPFSHLGLRLNATRSMSSGRRFGSSFLLQQIFNKFLVFPPGPCLVACAKMAAASFPWLNNPWQGVSADDAIVALVLVVPQR